MRQLVWPSAGNRSDSGSEHLNQAKLSDRSANPFRRISEEGFFRRRRDQQTEETNSILFSHVGEPRDTFTSGSRHQDVAEDLSALAPREGSLSHFFFGFLYDSDEDSQGTDHDELLEEILHESHEMSQKHPWTHHLNALNLSLFAALFLSSLAAVVPVILVPVLASQAQFSDAAASHADTSSFAPRAASAAVLGTALGKIINGPVGDLVGARRTTLLYTSLLALALVGLAVAQTPHHAVLACFMVEFASSVQWPCCIIILATHYRSTHHFGYYRHNHSSARHRNLSYSNSHGQSGSNSYEGGIYITSLASRLGSLIGIPTTSLLMRSYNLSWRVMALLAVWMALVSISVVYLYVHDSPRGAHEPQNPVDPEQLAKWFPDYYHSRRCETWKQEQSLNTSLVCGLGRQPSPMTGRLAFNLLWFIIKSNVIPSVKHLLKSGTFWSVAMAHTGSSVIRTSERILGTYLADTSSNTLSEARAAGLSVCLSVGTLVGLAVAGSLFARGTERQRKWLVSKLYLTTVIACYVLAFLAIPAVRRTMNEPGMVTVFQTLAIVAAGFGIAVQFYHIPGLVGATFGQDKGLFSAYVDGLAYGVASILWRIVSHVVSTGNPDGGGWAYGWAAVALLLIPSSLLMVEFMEHYFCRPRHKGSYETIIFA